MAPISPVNEMKLRSILMLPLIPLAMAACAYQGTPTTPVERNLTWYSYLNGDDMRPVCTAGAPDHYRLVYNGIYIEQVRAYDAVAGTPQSPGQITSRVLGKTDVRTLRLSAPRDVFTPWRGQTAFTPLGDDQLDRLKEALATDLDSHPLSGRLELPSDDFYWIVAACMDGEFRFNAFRWPSPRFEALKFPDLLSSWDKTGVPFNQPRKVDLFLLHQASPGEEMRNALRFNIAAEKNGLFGHRPLF